MPALHTVCLRASVLRCLFGLAVASAVGCDHDDSPPSIALCDNTAQGRMARRGCQFGPGSVCNAQKIPVQYIFVLMQENRSFDNYFGRFQDYLRDVLHRTDIRVNAYRDPESPDGIDVPGTPYELRSASGRAEQDRKLDPSYDPRLDAPFNPTVPGKDPPDAASKHYWTHARTDVQQCVSDTCHEWWCSHLCWDSGRMDGFFAGSDGYHEGGEPVASSPEFLSGQRALYYYDQSNIPFYYWLADHFALADHYFSSMLGPTYTNRDYFYAATSRGLVSNGAQYYGDTAAETALHRHGAPSQYAGTRAADPAVPRTPAGRELNTLYDALDTGGVRFTQWVRDRYTRHLVIPRYGSWYGAVMFVSPRTDDYDGQAGAGFEARVTEENRRLAARIAGGQDPAALAPQGSLHPVNILDADPVEDVNGEDEHPPGTPQLGQRLVYDMVRVLLANPEVWKRSVLLLTYDEAGGFYDHVAPPEACAPDDIAGPDFAGGAYGNGPHGDGSDALYGGRFDRYGVRVPLLLISPWAVRNRVSHFTYDHTSITRFIEARYGLGALTRRDANADPLLDLFDFSDAELKLRGQGPPGWGAEALPARFPNTPSEHIDPDAFAGADDIRRYGGAGPFDMKANDACLAAFPPAQNASPVDGALGARVYGNYDWTGGKPPPASYSADTSRPFPLK